MGNKGEKGEANPKRKEQIQEDLSREKRDVGGLQMKDKNTPPLKLLSGLKIRWLHPPEIKTKTKTTNKLTPKKRSKEAVLSLFVPAHFACVSCPRTSLGFYSYDCASSPFQCARDSHLTVLMFAI